MEDHYVAQLKVEFDSCDSTATGYLDKEELTELCHKLHLEAHLHLLLDTLLGDSLYARVNFEEFKDGFVAVLSRSLDLSTSDDESSYLEPVVPEEVKPKFVKGAKRYGRRTRPDAPQDGDRTGDPDAQNPPSCSPTGARRPKLPRSTSLESVEELLSERSADHSYGEGLPGHTPISSSTPIRPPHLQRDTHKPQGSTAPDRVLALWTEEGVRNGRDILQILDFSLEEVQAEQASRERDKAKGDLEQADRRNLKLVREVDDHHAAMETLNHSRIRDLEQEFRERLAALRSQSEQESEALQQQVEAERAELREEVELLKVQESRLQEDLHTTTQENRSLEEEVCVLKESLSAWTLRVPELQDRNDELSSELWRSQTSDRKSRRSTDEFETKRGVSPLARRKLDQSAVSIQTELAMEQLRDKHSQEIHSLRVDLETKVNFYERSLELMRNNMEVERKDISQSFKLEISETQREWAELDQNYAREINHLVQRLSAEKEELGAELKLKMDQEVMLVREEAEEKLSEVKLCHAEVQQQQSELWEKRLLQIEQENQKEKILVVEEAQEEVSRRCDQLSSERRRLEEQVVSLQEEVKMARYEQQDSNKLLSQSERRLEQREAELRCSEGRGSQLEAELKASEGQMSELGAALCTSDGRSCQLEAELRCSLGRSSELEARLQEACSQLEENFRFLEAHEEVKHRLTLERSSLEEELGLRRSREGDLLQEVSQLKEELDSLQAWSRSILQDSTQQKALLRAREESVASLQTDLVELQETLRTRGERQTELSSELNSLKMDRARLIQDLKEQAMASSLEEVREEAVRLSEEKSHYLRLADQLSTQIVEMEEEISSLRDHLRDLSVQLNQTANLVLDLKNQLRAKSAGLTHMQDQLADSQARREQVEGFSAQFHREVERLTSRLEEQERELSSIRDWAQLRGSTQSGLVHLQRELVEKQEELRRVGEASEAEKDRMKRHLLEMEELVVALEVLMEPGGPHRTSCGWRRNSRYREEVLEISGRNLQLSGENAELSSRLRGDEGAVRLLRERLEKVTKEQQEESAKVRELEEKEAQKERERLQLLSSWTHERELLERQLASAKDKVEQVEVLEADLVSLRLKQQWVEQDKTRLLEEAEHRTQQVEALQSSVCHVDGEVELLRSQLQSATQERTGHAQEVTSQHRKLQDVQREEERQEQAAGALQEEIQTLRLHNQDLLQRLRLHTPVARLHTPRSSASSHSPVAPPPHSPKLRLLTLPLSAVQAQEEELQRLTRECQTLRSRHTQLESARTQAEDQAVRSDTSRVVLQAQASQQLQEARREAEESSQQQLHLLRVRLEEQTRRSQRLEEELRAQAQQAGSQIHTHQERLQQTETKVKSLRLLLQEKTQQLEEQVSSSNQSCQLLQDLYLENSHLVRALQVTETRQKNAQKKNFMLEDKVSALNTLIREIVTMALAT
ncbi:hypothetical protein NHX12_022931 [Muraenolepis orangiensis]|uniref:EF-hand domain-containing protein n=1 Tax=Muraenolepis orangiensis TaxID=630683 RepID=A0A9Q0IVK7_9TELE|nr:hypothetical protein NHX12_022931 [Muraenolepis orangiensis]